jgi:uncharacterized protein
MRRDLTAKGRRYGTFHRVAMMRGHDLMAEQLAAQTHQPRGPSSVAGSHLLVPPKIALNGYGPTGFEVSNALKKVQDSAKQSAEQGMVHLCGSVLVFPTACFLWNGICRPRDVTAASLLGPVLLHRRPSRIEYLFVGCDDASTEIPQWDEIRRAFRHHGIVAERLNLLNAIGTYNILNAEDRQVVAALVLDPNDDDLGQDE